MTFILAISVFLVLSMIALGMTYTIKGMKGKNAKKIAGLNVLALFSVLVVATVLFATGNVSATEAVETQAQAVASQGAENGTGLGYIAAALATGLATIGAGIAVAVSGSAALGAISEDSRLLGKTLIFVGLAEGIAIYGLIVSILILGQL
ncbi:MAG: ATPase [Clostridiaceae bacterium]|nr:ATPase [Clostridiaceae bacterium]